MRRFFDSSLAMMDETRHRVLSEILKECFWEYRFTPEELMEIVLGNNEREQQFLFEKIFENSTNVLKALTIFPNATLTRLIKRQKPPRFKRDFLERRLKIVKFHFLKEKVSIPELDWQIPK